MPDPFLGEIRVFAFDFAPSGWAMCDGQLLPISQNTALFGILGTTYGGDGQNNFALPNLQGRFPIHVGQGPGQASYAPGQEGGTETVELQITEMPTHNHQVAASSEDADSSKPAGRFLANTGASAVYNTSTPDVVMTADMILPKGDGQPHENMPPYLALNFCIALQGTVPQ
jgi:microcystin-dependent protein